MKTMSDFKGSKEEFKLIPCANGGVILYLDQNQQIQIRCEHTAKLLANSKKVLEMLIDAGEYIYISAFNQAGLWGCNTDRAKEFADDQKIIRDIDKLINDSL